LCLELRRKQHLLWRTTMVHDLGVSTSAGKNAHVKAATRTQAPQQSRQGHTAAHQKG
jgi:hypothetical protein